DAARPIDYFGRDGTTYDVARLLAHEAITVAAATSAASGRQAPPLHPAVATDCIDRALGHWAEPDAGVDWHHAPAHLAALDTGRSWWIRFGGAPDGIRTAIAPSVEAPPAVTVTAPAGELLHWL